uniref:Uncharacterized protein n=1 Tax=Physcomitrium patens TaxID=3218 RepID=A0A7I4E2J5_PHYPA
MALKLRVMDINYNMLKKFTLDSEYIDMDDILAID